jgi:hypothetical protein
MRWLDSIKEATGLRLEDLREAVQDRKKWRALVEERTRNRERTISSSRANVVRPKQNWEYNTKTGLR